ncbi:hypothetical protein [Curtobacterium flaccumfaciens]|uniref:hypothetical protein n=1 Tax=Curtobacterium flaccumfaciens TaxID=2035 RepID=UPI0012E01213|nr:hypothetical protein [Curtobacterium flaccumfaciens]
MANFLTRNLDSLKDLALDPYNPRLRKDEEGSDENTLIGIMLARFKIEEVAESILVAGWLEQDPLIGVTEAGQVRVVEGNRRLTAVKLLLDPSLAPPARRTKWQGYAKDLSEEQRTDLDHLSVRVYDSRDDPEVSAYIGFRHVTGVLPWPALEKASYIARLAAKGESYAQLAEKLGSYPSHMARHHLAFEIVEQADEWQVDGREQMSNAFGVLLRSLQTEGVRKFLGVEQADEPLENVNPVPDATRTNFEDFVRWTFGTEDRSRILPESRELTRWSKILQSEPAVRYLRNAKDPKFDRAWARSGGESESVADALWKASYALADVLPLISKHVNDDQVKEAVEEVNRYTQQINVLMAAKQADA